MKYLDKQMNKEQLSSEQPCATCAAVCKALNILELADPVLAIQTRSELAMKAVNELVELKARVFELEDVLRSARAIAQRKGVETAWDRFDKRIERLGGIGSITAKVFKVLPSDKGGAS